MLAPELYKNKVNHTKSGMVGSDFSCHDLFHIERQYKDQLPEIIDAVVAGCEADDAIVHLDLAPIPSKDAVVKTIHELEDILYPGFFGKQHISSKQLKYHLGEEISRVFDELSTQIMKAYMHECYVQKKECLHCGELAQEQTLVFLKKIPTLKKLLDGDIRTAYNNDPAAKSLYEIVFCYPGIKAITSYRIAHELHLQGVPLIPRIITEHAHSVTGIDIHPGATIGKHFFIDHGNDIVIGETTTIGDDVVIYQGVTLGAPKQEWDEAGTLIREQKRHPTIGDRVVIYSGSTILGGETVIGDDSVIGGNAWITESVPPNSKVVLKYPQLKFKECCSQEGRK